MDFIVIVKILINFLLNQSILFFAEFLKDKPNKLKQNKKTRQEKKHMCMIHLQNYIISCWKHLMMNTTIYQMQKEVE